MKKSVTLEDNPFLLNERPFAAADTMLKLKLLGQRVLISSVVKSYFSGEGLNLGEFVIDLQYNDALTLKLMIKVLLDIFDVM